MFVCNDQKLNLDVCLVIMIHNSIIMFARDSPRLEKIVFDLRNMFTGKSF